MSFGSLSGAAVEALNRGAALAGCLQNTGEGGLSPHFLVLAVAEGGQANPAGALAIGIAFTPSFAAEEIGRMPQVTGTAAAVRAAIEQALG